MDIKHKAGQVVSEAEDRLQALIAEAAHSGEYAAIELLAACASDLQAIHQRFHGDLPASEVADVTDAGAEKQAPVPPPPAQKPSPRKKSSPRKAKRKSSYPKFARIKDLLIKIGWSKAKKSEYRHKAPLAAIKALTAALGQAFESESVVAMESILPLSAEDGEEVPDYQAYLCMAWLRNLGVVKQHGREGYAINVKINELSGKVETEWENLPKAKP
jgi:hypothetical protein